MKSHRLSQKRKKAANVLSAKRNPEVVNVKGSRMHPEVGHGFLKSAQPGITWKCGEDVEMDLTADIIVDDHVEIADHVKIFTHRHEWRHSRGLRKDIQKITAHSLTIGRDAFIGMGAMLIGVEEIGEGAIIGAGAVVRVKKIGPYEIWIGNPAELNGIRGSVITLDCL